MFHLSDRKYATYRAGEGYFRENRMTRMQIIGVVWWDISSPVSRTRRLEFQKCRIRLQCISRLWKFPINFKYSFSRALVKIFYVQDGRCTWETQIRAYYPLCIEKRQTRDNARYPRRIIVKIKFYDKREYTLFVHQHSN